MFLITRTLSGFGFFFNYKVNLLYFLVAASADTGSRNLNICSSVVRAFAHGRRIDPSWGGPIELFLVPASAPRLV